MAGSVPSGGLRAVCSILRQAARLDRPASGVVQSAPARQPERAACMSITGAVVGDSTRGAAALGADSTPSRSRRVQPYSAGEDLPARPAGESSAPAVAAL